MPCRLPLGVSTLVLKSACASSHSTRSFLPVLAAVARHGADAADGQAVVAAQQDGQPACCSSASTASCTAWFQATTSARWR
jgi:hypothetical protein